MAGKYGCIWLCAGEVWCVCVCVCVCVYVCGKVQCTYSGCGRRQRWSGRVTVRWVVTCAFAVGRAQGGAALGWTAAFPKRNHRISSTHDRRRGEERIVCMWGCGPVHQYRQAKGVCVHETRPACMWTYARTHTKRRTFKCPPKYTHTNLTT